ncbi:L-2-hydroxyglutarate oxidase [Synechococcus sp. HIMB2401]|uniref:L-2-hydroxyglutarate oxidase n=1 Tax=Synechococcus sp. HIMB2401 TaxID=3144208 RepID=UPI0036F40835
MRKLGYKTFTYDIVIIGGGITGLSLANQIIEKRITNRIAIIDKEQSLGIHTSGRNSGVIHAGIYYKPNTLKAQVCVEGARRLKTWIQERNLPYKQCGKIIVPTKEHLDGQLDELLKRGHKNGATVELLNEKDLKKKAPEVKSASGRGLWSPNTAVVKPLKVIQALQNELKRKGVHFILNERSLSFDQESKKIAMQSGESIQYEHLFNCAGLQADNIAQEFGVGDNYLLVPFRGLYWQIKQTSKIKPSTNIYPVPDLSVPFLGVHFTPSADKQTIVSIGPTATPSWGREHYKGFKGIEPKMAIQNASLLAKQYALNQGNFRRYVHEQAFLSLPPLLLRAAKELIPAITINDIEVSNKVAIRAQLFNKEKKQLEDDFLCVEGTHSTHVLNAISPAFTASFALADLILERSGFLNTTT